ncbi:MAG: histidine kinase [Thermacetogeniaceae bacterium]|jgi:two-component system sensor histidine kinase DegS
MADLQSLNRVVRRTLVAVEEGRQEIFGIAEVARDELGHPQPVPEMLAARETADSFQEKRPDLPETERQNLAQVAEQADMLLTRFGVALQCLQGAAPGPLAVRMLDNERRRIAREIHDGPAQALANLLLRTVFCEQQLAGEPSVVRDELLNLKEIIRSSLLEIRKILFDLQSKNMNQGLVCGLRQLIDEYQERYGLPVIFNCSDQERQLDSQVAGTLFRIVQEALNNIYKHSRSDHAQVDLELEEYQVTVHIFDEGKGFDLQEVASSDGHYGLMNMRERVQLLDGSLQIMTAPGQGTRIIVTIPIV